MLGRLQKHSKHFVFSLIQHEEGEDEPKKDGRNVCKTHKFYLAKNVSCLEEARAAQILKK